MQAKQLSTRGSVEQEESGDSPVRFWVGAVAFTRVSDLAVVSRGIVRQR